MIQDVIFDGPRLRHVRWPWATAISQFSSAAMKAAFPSCFTRHTGGRVNVAAIVTSVLGVFSGSVSFSGSFAPACHLYLLSFLRQHSYQELDVNPYNDCWAHPITSWSNFELPTGNKWGLRPPRRSDVLTCLSATPHTYSHVLIQGNPHYAIIRAKWSVWESKGRPSKTRSIVKGKGCKG